MPSKYNLILGRMKQYGITQNDLATAIKRNVSTVNLKLNGKGEFNQSEIRAICSLLNIPSSETATFFLL